MPLQLQAVARPLRRRLQVRSGERPGCESTLAHCNSAQHAFLSMWAPEVLEAADFAQSAASSAEGGSSTGLAVANIVASYGFPLEAVVRHVRAGKRTAVH